MPPAAATLEPADAAPPVRPAIAFALVAVGAALLLHPNLPLELPARQALGVFGLALVAWTVLRWDETAVALAAALALLATGTVTPEAFRASLGADLVWLLVGAFVIGAAWQQTGLVERWLLQATAGARTLRGLAWRSTLLVSATAFVVPSTSARAALLRPVFDALAARVGDARARRALGLLFPTVILLSAGASLLGAGAHLVAADMVDRLGGPRLGVVGWALVAAPFALATCALATLVVLHGFLAAPERARRLAAPDVPRLPLSRGQRAVAGATAATLAAWCTTAWHGMDAWAIALAGALAVTLRPLTGVELRTALKKVEWNLLLFLAATLVMGRALVDSGAARALAEGLLAAWPAAAGPRSAVLLAAAVALAAHLVVPSRTARATLLIPTVALPLAATGADPVLLVMVVTLGSGFCQTLAVSAKPVTLFAGGETPPFGDADLLRLAGLLALPLYGLLAAFALIAWPAQL
jgi:sodium-dependent dicarboxylate transporter 2/3/5